MRLRNRILAGFILGIFGALSTSHAEDMAESTLPSLVDLSLEDLLNIVIVTASRHEESLLDTPATVIVIKRQQIEARGYHNLIDLMQDLPGVDIQRHSDPTRYNDISLRGHFTHRKFMILQDGVRIDAPTGETLAVADNFPLHHAQRVEVVYGPASAVYGADAFGGVINIITRDGKQAEGVRVSAYTGNDGYRYYTATAGTQFGDQWKLALNAHSHENNMDLAGAYPGLFAPVDASSFSGDVIVPAAQRETFANPTQSRSLFARIDYGTHFSAGLQRSFFRQPSATGDRPSRSLYLDDARWENKLTVAYAKYSADINAKLSTTTTLNYAQHEETPASRFNNIFTNFGDGYKYAKGERLAIEQQFNYRFHDAHLLTGGVSYEDYYAIPRTPDLPTPYDTGLAPDTQGLFYPNTNDSIAIDILDLNYHNQAAYLQVQSTWNTHWTSVIGVRYDDNSRYASTFNPRVGLVYKPNAKTAYKLLYGEAFRAPAAHESIRVFGSFTGEQNATGQYVSDFFAAPNLDLQPEKLHNLEFTVLRQWNNLQAMLSAYYTEVDGIIFTRAQTPPSQFIPGADLLYTNISDNLGAEQHYGVDITVDYQHKLSRGLEAEWWAAYSFIKGTVSSNSNAPDVDLPFVAEHKLKFGTTLTYQKNYFISPRVALIGATASDSNRKAPGYGIMDVYMGVRDVVPGLTLSLGITNLFDRKYYNAGGATSSTAFTQTPQQTRAWVLGASYRF